MVSHSRDPNFYARDNKYTEPFMSALMSAAATGMSAAEIIVEWSAPYNDCFIAYSKWRSEMTTAVVGPNNSYIFAYKITLAFAWRPHQSQPSDFYTPALSQ